MRLSLALTFVVALTTPAMTQSGNAQTPVYVTEPEAMQIYATFVAGFWSGQPENPILLQQETDNSHVNGCGDSHVPSSEPEWVEVRKSFDQQNAGRKLLPLSLPIAQPYRLLTPAQFERFIGPLKVKYPENYMEHSPLFVRVSAVGFNASKTKAMVSIALPDRGQVIGVELRDGKWITAPNSSICTWIV
jgi:hypothetical protein